MAKRLDERLEGKISFLHVAAAANEPDGTGLLHPGQELLGQARFADAGIARHQVLVPAAPSIAAARRSWSRRSPSYGR